MKKNLVDMLFQDLSHIYPTKKASFYTRAAITLGHKEARKKQKNPSLSLHNFMQEAKETYKNTQDYLDYAFLWDEEPLHMYKDIKWDQIYDDLRNTKKISRKDWLNNPPEEIFEKFRQK
jgi:hypothetical protein